MVKKPAGYFIFLAAALTLGCAPEAKRYSDLTPEVESACYQKVSISLDKSAYVGEDDLATLTVSSEEINDSFVEVSIKSEYDGKGLNILCERVSPGVYKGSFKFLQGGVSNSLKKELATYPSAGYRVMISPLFTTIRAFVDYEGKRYYCSSVWWPNPFYVYHDTDTGEVWQHLAYDQEGANGAKILAWTSGGSVSEISSGGNPGACYKLTENSGPQGYAGFGAFFDSDQDSTPDPQDLSVYYGGYLQFDVKTDAPPVDVIVQVEYGNGRFKKTAVVTCNSTSWETKVIDLGEDMGHDGYLGLSTRDMKAIRGPAIFTIGDVDTSVYIDNVLWGK